MITRVLESIAELESLQEAWGDLLARAEGTTPFQTHLFNRIWWETLGGGEWDHGELRLFAGFDPQHRLVGLAPLFRTGARMDEFRLIGSLEISDYLDLILDPDFADEFIRALLDDLLHTSKGRSVRLILDNLLEESPTIPLIAMAAAEKGWGFIQERTGPAPLLRLPPSMEAYLEQLESKQRREFKRKMRRAEDYPARVTWRIQDQAGQIAPDLERFLALMSNDSEKRAFLSERMRDHFRGLIVGGSEAGLLHLALLEVSGETVFGYLNFIDRQRIWVYNSGFDPDHFSLSPGWVLMGHLIEWAIERGFEAIDFMRGDEDYKYRLGGTDRFICRLTLEP